MTVTMGQAGLPALLSYCEARRFDRDESFLDENSLSLFRQGPGEKTVLLIDGSGRAVMTAGMRLDSCGLCRALPDKGLASTPAGTADPC